MKISRRTALKLSLVTAFSLTRKHSIFAMVASARPSDVLAARARRYKAGRWVMVIDLKKCLAAKDCHDACVHACHETHNVPDLGNKKDAVKWIWRKKAGTCSPTSWANITARRWHAKRFLLLCNHCANAPCTRVCPDGGDLQARSTASS